MHNILSVKFSQVVPVLLLVVLTACSQGGSSTTTTNNNNGGVALPFAATAIPNAKTDLHASLVCPNGSSVPMTIDTGANTLHGSCNNLSPGTHQYFTINISYGVNNVQLASATSFLDIIQGTNASLVFTAGDYDTSFDDDGDGFTNLHEIANNMDPAVTNYHLGGNISGLVGNLVIANGNDTLTVSGDGSYELNVGLLDGVDYQLSITTQPNGQTCNISSTPGGTITGSNVNNLDIACTTNPSSFTYNNMNPVYAVGSAISTNAPTSPVAGTTYSVDPPLPPGLTLNATTGDITGTPTAVTAAAIYVISAVNNSGTIVANLGISIVPSVNFTTSSQNVSEGVTGGTVNLTVALDYTSTVDVKVPYTVTGGTAINGTDYNLSNSTITIVAGQTSASISVSIINDVVVESNKTIIIDLGTPINAKLGTQTTHTVTIIDNDFTVGGSVTGYTSSGLVLQNNSANNLPVSGSSFTFSTALNDGSIYHVSVLTQPSGQFCHINNSEGSIAGSNITNVNVICVNQMTLNVSSSKPKTLAFNWSAVTGATLYKLLVNPDGKSGYTQVGTDITATNVNVEIPVHLTDWVNASYMLEAYSGTTLIDDSPAAGIVNAMINSIGYFKASNTDANDYFASVALSKDGNTLAVGAPGEASNGTSQTDNSLTNVGAVYIFVRENGAWSQQAYLKASNAGASDSFGTSVALSANGDTLAVGALGESSKAIGVNCNPNLGNVATCQADDTSAGSGATYIFTRSAKVWTQQFYIKPSYNTAGDNFGSHVSLSDDGTTLAVSAVYEDSAATGINGTQVHNCDPLAPVNCATTAGAVYIFNARYGTWYQDDYIKPFFTAPTQYFGWSIALSGDGTTLAVGAFYESSAAAGIGGTQTYDCANSINCRDASGAVYIFSYSGSGWSQQEYIKASVPDIGDNFGNAVALSYDGNTLAVGAYTESSNATGISTVPLAPGEYNNAASHAGAVYLFSRSANIWKQDAYIKASNTTAHDLFGADLALSSDGNTLAVNAPQEGGAATGINGDQVHDCTVTPKVNCIDLSGAVYIFNRSSNGLQQRAYVKPKVTNMGDSFGSYVALSSDGNVLAVGAQLEDSAAKAINGDPVNHCSNTPATNCALNSGAVYVY